MLKHPQLYGLALGILYLKHSQSYALTFAILCLDIRNLMS